MNFLKKFKGKKCGQMDFHFLKDWFTYEDISFASAHKKMGGCTLPSFIKFHRCKLKLPLVHFPIGTEFETICMNSCNVLYFNIKGDIKHVCEPDGFNYLGHFDIMIKDNIYSQILGINGFCYLKKGVYTGKFCGFKGYDAKSGSGYFKYTKVLCHENTKHYPKDMILNEVKFDFTKGVFVSENNDDMELKVKLMLKPRSIPTDFLKSEYKKRNIDKFEYDDTICRREKYRFDVENPPNLIV